MMRIRDLPLLAALTCVALPASDPSMLGVGPAPTIADLTVGDVNDFQVGCDGCKPFVQIRAHIPGTPDDQWYLADSLSYAGTSVDVGRPPFSFAVHFDMLTTYNFSGTDQPIIAGACLPDQEKSTCDDWVKCNVAFDVHVDFSSDVRLSGDGWFGTGNTFATQTHCGKGTQETFIKVTDRDSGTLLMTLHVLYGCDDCDIVVVPANVGD